MKLELLPLNNLLKKIMINSKLFRNQWLDWTKKCFILIFKEFRQYYANKNCIMNAVFLKVTYTKIQKPD